MYNGLRLDRAAANLLQAAIALNSHRATVVLILLGLLPLLAGCGRGKRVERLPVHGTVTLSNGEKPSGSITFLPAKGQLGPAATTKLAEGSYKFDRSNGPAAGPQTVIVKRVVSRSRIPDKKPLSKVKAEWTEAANVSDDGQYLHNFTLEE